MYKNKKSIKEKGMRHFCSVFASFSIRPAVNDIWMECVWMSEIRPFSATWRDGRRLHAYHHVPPHLVINALLTHFCPCTFLKDENEIWLSSWKLNIDWFFSHLKTYEYMMTDCRQIKNYTRGIIMFLFWMLMKWLWNEAYKKWFKIIMT